MTGKLLAVTFDLDAPGRLALTQELGPGVEVLALPGLDEAARRAALGRTACCWRATRAKSCNPGRPT